MVEIYTELVPQMGYSTSLCMGWSTDRTVSSYNESTESSIEETSSSASTITRPNIQQINSFLREII
ncbi:CNT_collapsed_G0006890.mRNA.1.CDS.1 [Saccharomyces cerevisiae]|nr:CNT_collapsed_G0006890.mRNA.1.CDS.1 [Saccharomyces cerevisiae]